MEVLGINRILGWVQILHNGKKFTCVTKDINGQLLFKFKNEWHDVARHVGKHTTELVDVGGKIISQTINKK